MSLIDRCEQLWCGLTGHTDTMREVTDGRLHLRCACGWVSPGVQVTRPTLKRTAPINLILVRGERLQRTA